MVQEGGEGEGGGKHHEGAGVDKSKEEESTTRQTPQIARKQPSEDGEKDQNVGKEEGAKREG